MMTQCVRYKVFDHAVERAFFHISLLPIECHDDKIIMFERRIIEWNDMKRKVFFIHLIFLNVTYTQIHIQLDVIPRCIELIYKE